MTTWVRITARSMWHVEVSRAGGPVIVTDCGRTFWERKPERHEGARPARGRACRECWWGWYNWHRRNPHMAARADWTEQRAAWQVRALARSPHARAWAAVHRRAMRDDALRYAARRGWRVEWSEARAVRVGVL